MGSKRNARYRIIAIDSKSRRDGKPVEYIGIYQPTDGLVKVDHEAALKWLHRGAQPTETVRNIFSHEGIMTKFHNEKTGSKLEVKTAVAGSVFGAEVDKTVGYTAPGTKIVEEEVEEVKEIIEEAMAEAN